MFVSVSVLSSLFQILHHDEYSRRQRRFLEQTLPLPDINGESLIMTSAHVRKVSASYFSYFCPNTSVQINYCLQNKSKRFKVLKSLVQLNFLLVVIDLFRFLQMSCCFRWCQTCRQGAWAHIGVAYTTVPLMGSQSTPFTANAKVPP